MIKRPADVLLKHALKELEDLDRQLQRIDRRTPVDFFPDKTLMLRIRNYLTVVEGQ
mgnify:CR=1 FL=1